MNKIRSKMFSQQTLSLPYMVLHISIAMRLIQAPRRRKKHRMTRAFRGCDGEKMTRVMRSSSPSSSM